MLTTISQERKASGVTQPPFEIRLDFSSLAIRNKAWRDDSGRTDVKIMRDGDHVCFIGMSCFSQQTLQAGVRILAITKVSMKQQDNVTGSSGKH